MEVLIRTPSAYAKNLNKVPVKTTSCLGGCSTDREESGFPSDNLTPFFEASHAVGGRPRGLVKTCAFMNIFMNERLQAPMLPLILDVNNADPHSFQIPKPPGACDASCRSKGALARTRGRKSAPCAAGKTGNDATAVRAAHGML